jgi:regulator of protease activity HflC (stomatin/prohibitin superfamily)
MVEHDEKHLPLKRAESAALFNLIVQAVAGGVALLLGTLSRSAAAEAEAWHLFVGAFIWLGCLVHQRLRRLAAEEALTAESLKAVAPDQRGASLFEAEGVDLQSARSRLAQFERYFLPAFSVLIALILGVLSYYLIQKLATAGAAPRVEEPLRNLSIFTGIAFVSFLLAKYSAGLATQAAWRPVRPGANYMMSNALCSLLVAIAFGFGFAEIPEVERAVAWAIPGVMSVLAVETLLSLLMSLYRPRVPGQEHRAAHDSRLLGMLTTSRGILRTTAETLDYQFGFKVSETWFYRFMERALGPLILFQAITLVLLTSFVIVGPGEEAVIERFGRPREGRQVLGPGFHLKWPWPIETCRRYPVRQVEVLAIGEQLVEDVPGYLWTRSHAKQPFNLLVANRERELEAPAPKTPEGAQPPKRDRRVPSGVSLITGTVYVYYHVRDLHDFLYNHEDPARTLRTLCYRELARYAAQSDFLEFLGYKRGEAVAELRGAIQKAADGLQLGVAIVDVTLQGLHPPVDVAGAFEEVVGAMQEREAKVWNARGRQSEKVQRALGNAAWLRAGAQIYAADRRHVAPAAEKAFLAQIEASRDARPVFMHRKLLKAIEEALADARKIVKPAAAGILHLDLEEKMPGLGTSFTQEGTTP